MILHLKSLFPGPARPFLALLAFVVISSDDDLQGKEVANGALVEKIPVPALISGADFFKTEKLGETYEVGVLRVPMDHDEPEARTIELFYLRLFATGGKGEAEPLLYFSGGPGGSGVAELTTHPVLRGNLETVRKSRDVVTFDQRGTGLSFPLLLGVFEPGFGPALERLSEDEQSTISDLLNDPEDSSFLTLAFAFQLYASAGVDLGEWNSLNTSSDAALLMDALGYSKFHVMGTSYGSKMAQVMARQYPDRTVSAVLDGVVPTTNAAMAGHVGEAAEQWVRIFEMVERDPKAKAVYPDLKKRFGVVLKDLAETPWVLKEPIEPSGFDSLVLAIAGGKDFASIEKIDIPFLLSFGEAHNSWNGRFQLAAFLANSPQVPYEALTYLDEIPLLIKAIEKRDEELLNRVLKQSGLTFGEWMDRLMPTPEIGSGVKRAIREIQNPFTTKTLAHFLSVAETPAGTEGSPGELWLTLVVDELKARAEKEENPDDVVEDLIKLLLLPVRGGELERYQNYGDETLSEDGQKAAERILAGLDRNQLRELGWMVNHLAASMSQSGESMQGLRRMVLWAVNLNESTAFRTEADVEAALAASAYPEMRAFEDKTWKQIKAVAELLPPTEVDKSFILPLKESKVPALLIQGGIDTHTPQSEAEEAATFFTTSTLAIFPTEGHVVTGLIPDYPGDLISRFLAAPAEPVDLEKIKQYTIQFDLPSGSVEGEVGE